MAETRWPMIQTPTPCRRRFGLPLQPPKQWQQPKDFLRNNLPLSLSRMVESKPESLSPRLPTQGSSGSWSRSRSRSSRSLKQQRRLQTLSRIVANQLRSLGQQQRLI